MTWIKPSAAWMGYRSGWGRKDANQARVLAVDLHRSAFDRLLAEAVLAKAQGPRDAEGGRAAPAPVVVQWDPELKGSVGEGPNQTNHSDRSSVRILGIQRKLLSKFRNFR